MKRVTDRKDVVVYNGSGNLKIEVLADANTVWLNRQQLALMFGRDVKTIGKHIANALKEELKGVPTVAKFATLHHPHLGALNIFRRALARLRTALSRSRGKCAQSAQTEKGDEEAIVNAVASHFANHFGVPQRRVSVQSVVA